ncbi:hypothetical protein [Agromyces sp. LHK192]|uniref:hypothetical protein n=1 Tax=Agromyces sp. LHK192 TaxID=2498704 RepID=UPI000FD93E0E|nr:hypothetical protein [Agromyces sp. LHK192]
MSDPTPTTAPPRRSRATTWAMYLAIGMLIAAAVLGGFFIIVGDQANIAARAWLTLLLVAIFAGTVVLDANVSDGPNRWYLPASVTVNVVLVAVGLIKLWNGWGQPADTADPGVWTVQLGRFVLVIILLRLALLVTQLYILYFVSRAKKTTTKAFGIATVVFVGLTALVLAIPAAFPEPDWPDWWWRTAAATSLVAVVTAVIPVIIRAFEPKDPTPAPTYGAPAGYGQVPPGYAPQQVPPGYAPAQAPPGYAPQQVPPAYAPQPVPPGYPAPTAPQVPPGYAQPPAPPTAPPPAPAAPPQAPPAGIPPQAPPRRPRRSRLHPRRLRSDPNAPAPPGRSSLPAGCRRRGLESTGHDADPRPRRPGRMARGARQFRA